MCTVPCLGIQSRIFRMTHPLNEFIGSGCEDLRLLGRCAFLKCCLDLTSQAIIRNQILCTIRICCFDYIPIGIISIACCIAKSICLSNYLISRIIAVSGVFFLCVICIVLKTVIQSSVIVVRRYLFNFSVQLIVNHSGNIRCTAESGRTIVISADYIIESIIVIGLNITHGCGFPAHHQLSIVFIGDCAFADGNSFRLSH